jgi:hypothetical protein
MFDRKDVAKLKAFVVGRSRRKQQCDEKHCSSGRTVFEGSVSFDFELWA